MDAPTFRPPAIEKRHSSLLGRLLIAGLVATVAWTAFAALFAQMYGSSAPHGAGFDFQILLTAAGRIAAGQSPYDPALLTGSPTGITELFYTYPPFVAQMLVPVVGLPSIVVIGGFLAAAVAMAAVVLGISAAQGFGLPRSLAVLLALVALPSWFPFTLALLFANVDAVFVAADGVLLAAVLTRAPSRILVVVAGIALAITAIAKLQPAVLCIWLVARGFRTRHVGPATDADMATGFPAEWRVAGVALVAGAVVVAGSVLAGGIGMWVDYVTMLRTSTGTGLLDRRNLGPVVQLAMLLGLGASAVAPMQLVIDIAVVAGVSAAALRIDDLMTSFTCALVGSLVVLPVTWFHHFAVLIVALVAGLSRVRQAGGSMRRIALAAGAAFGIGVVGFGTVVTWLLIVPVLAAARSASPSHLAADGRQPVVEPLA